jgi:hypothetical protein
MYGGWLNVQDDEAKSTVWSASLSGGTQRSCTRTISPISRAISTRLSERFDSTGPVLGSGPTRMVAAPNAY